MNVTHNMEKNKTNVRLYLSYILHPADLCSFSQTIVSQLSFRHMNNILKAAIRFCIKRFKTMKESRALTSSFAPPFRTNQGENTLKPNLVNSAGIGIKDRRSRRTL